ncbi:MAG: hypothetical protein M1818_000046 [Claussenomyces sp. TS43310]|nr:MAG: hypothetical protein M1818_000046 [Claussenomyces sp. TS43310]
MSENHARLSPALVETVAGLGAGIASTLAVHPLDVIKTRLQTPALPPHETHGTDRADLRTVHRSFSRTPVSSLAVLRSLTSSDRPLQSLYRGLTPNLLGNASAWALFFYFKSTIESRLRVLHRGPLTSIPSSSDAPTSRHQQLSPADYFTSSLLSGALVTLSTNPIWVIKTRMLTTDAATKGAYPSMWAGMKSLWQMEGLKGFYRGLGAGMIGVSHGAVQFAVYDSLKGMWSHYVEPAARDSAELEGTKLSNAATLVISGTAKVVAGTVTYPYQVVRSRLQTHDAEEKFGKGIKEVLARVWRQEGWRGFYRGVGPNIMKVLPATWVTFLVYENLKFYLPRWIV